MDDPFVLVFGHSRRLTSCLTRNVLRTLREAVDTATPADGAVVALMSTLAEPELKLGRK